MSTGTPMHGQTQPSCLDWVNNTLIEAVSSIGEYVLFCDNLNGQILSLFQEAVRSTQGIDRYWERNVTYGNQWMLDTINCINA